MENKKEFTAEERKQILRELKEKYPEELEEFSIELHLAIDIFFKGETERDGQTITLTNQKGQKFRVTAEMIK